MVVASNKMNKMISRTNKEVANMKGMISEVLQIVGKKKGEEAISSQKDMEIILGEEDDDALMDE